MPVWSLTTTIGPRALWPLLGHNSPLITTSARLSTLQIRPPIARTPSLRTQPPSPLSTEWCGSTSPWYHCSTPPRPRNYSTRDSQLKKHLHRTGPYSTHGLPRPPHGGQHVHLSTKETFFELSLARTTISVAHESNTLDTVTTSSPLPWYSDGPG